MKAVSKSVLFARAQHGKTTHQWPVAAFANTPAAKTYAFLIRNAYKSGDVEMVTSLDPNVRKADDGTLLTDMRWSVVEVPYAPTLPDMNDSDDIS